MSRIRGKDTLPELRVRSQLHRMGYRFRLHRKDLPGKPDIVLPRYKTVVFIHGCFWHRHRGCRLANMPKTRKPFWQEKFAANVERDRKNGNLLRKDNWRVVAIWECETADKHKLDQRLSKMMEKI